MRPIKLPNPIGEIWMEVRDVKKLQRLMIVQDVSQRQLAVVAGYKTHTYMGKILRGEAKTLNTEPALRIAKFLGVGVEDLFLTKVSTIPDQNGRRNVSTRATLRSVNPKAQLVSV